jgi:HlyD family secretion protein
VLSVVAALVVLVTGGCSGDPDKGISLGTVRVATVSEVVDAPAAVTARATATVTAPAEGRVATLLVKDGEGVNAGTVLAVIDSPSARQRLAQARQAAAAADAGSVRVPAVDLGGVQAQTDVAANAAFAQEQAAIAQLPGAAARATAQRQLAASRAQYAATQAQARLAVRQFNAGLAGLGAALRSLTAAQRAQAGAAVSLAQATVDALTLRAPIRGTVQLGGTSSAATGGLSDLLGSLPAGAAGAAGAAAPTASGTPSVQNGASPQTVIAPGAIVAQGTAVVTVVDVSALGLQADVDETDVLLVKPGVRARVELDAVPDASYDATVAAVDLSPTTSARGGVSYHVRLTLGAGRDPAGVAAPAPRPGMSAVAHLLVRTARDAVAVRASAIVRAGVRNAVWVVRDGVARLRDVTVGTQGADTVAITEGVRPGDRVVVTGTERVHAGQKLS